MRGPERKKKKKRISCLEISFWKDSDSVSEFYLLCNTVACVHGVVCIEGHSDPCMYSKC